MHGTKGDYYTKEIIERILDEGCMDINPRPRYIDTYEGEYNKNFKSIITSDGRPIRLLDNNEIEIEKGIIKVYTPAHTLSVNHVFTTYNLAKGETPLITLRPIATKTSVAEFLWIYQCESNDLVEFDELIGKNTWNEDKKINNWWEEWALKDNLDNYILNDKGHPTIGHCYGNTIADHDMMRALIDGIKKDPDGRRHIINMWQVDDFKDSHGLKPCAFMTMWNVRHGRDGIDYLDMSLIQRSSDFLTAGCINQFQYVILQEAIARHLGYVPGRFSWFAGNVQIYDRHFEQANIMLDREPIDCEPKVVFTNESTNFYDLKPNDVKIEGYPRELIKKKNPQLKFQIAI